MQNKYMVSWVEDLYEDIGQGWNNFYYEEDDANGCYYLVVAENRVEATEQFLQYMYRIVIENMPREEFEESLFYKFVEHIIEEVVEDMFVEYSRKDEIYGLALKIYDYHLNVLMGKGLVEIKNQDEIHTYSYPGDVKFLEEVFGYFRAEDLFSLLSSEDENKMWIEYNKRELAVIELVEI